MDLAGKTVLITGAQRVGQHVARALAEAGASLMLTYLKDPQEVADVVDDVATLPGQHAISYPLDLSNEPSVIALTEAIAKERGYIDALVNMASIFAPDHTPLRWNDIQHVFSVNAFGTMLLSRWFAEAAAARGAKSAPIVSFIDWAVDHPYKDHDVYLASKASLRHYLMALQTSFAGAVRVINVHPGMILEPAGFPAAEKKEIIDHTPVHAIGDPTQAAKLVRVALELDFWADNVTLAGGQQWRHRL